MAPNLRGSGDQKQADPENQQPARGPSRPVVDPRVTPTTPSRDIVEISSTHLVRIDAKASVAKRYEESLCSRTRFLSALRPTRDHFTATNGSQPRHEIGSWSPKLDRSLALSHVPAVLQSPRVIRVPKDCGNWCLAGRCPSAFRLCGLPRQQHRQGVIGGLERNVKARKRTLVSCYDHATAGLVAMRPSLSRTVLAIRSRL